jgi:hypothetical protein
MHKISLRLGHSQGDFLTPPPMIAKYMLKDQYFGIFEMGLTRGFEI